MLFLMQAVGKGCPNRPEDVKSLHKCLMEIAKIPCYVCDGAMDERIMDGIDEVQRHFLQSPDCVISVDGMTHRFLSSWKNKPISTGVQLPGRLREAWDWVDPLLPDGSYCSSGFRSAEDQRRILHKFFSLTYRASIIAKYGKPAYDAAKSDLVKNESQVLTMVRGVGQAIAAPGKSMHQRGKAIDVGGPSTIDKRQVEIVKLVAKAHTDLYSGVILRERNGCVHFEIR